MQATFLGEAPFHNQKEAVEGAYVQLKGEKFYKISNYDEMRPFFMSLVSHSDHWLFISSAGGLTAGRVNENSVLFPYATDDKLMEDSAHTGSHTTIKVKSKAGDKLWEPFSDRYEGIYRLRRNLYKNVTGNCLWFEEENLDLNLVFRYSWTFSDDYGFVRQAELVNVDESNVSVELLDGIQNVMPWGINPTMQKERSNLTHAYKKSELEKEASLGLYMLSAVIVDKAEPSEALKCTTVWSAGLEQKLVLLSSMQISDFRKGKEVQEELDVRAEKGSYLLHTTMTLDAKEEKSWTIVAEVNQTHADVISLKSRLTSNADKLIEDLRHDIDLGTQSLRKLVGMADGLQLSADERMTGRHYSNVLFNIMRGGIFEDQYDVHKENFLSHVAHMNKEVSDRCSVLLEGLPTIVNYQTLLSQVQNSEDSDLIRLTYEYLPLSFSRRHGDPSRPWNKFSIEVKKEDGSKNQYYEGNWRDIFQNWEALALSFPGYLESMITRFVNASTIDGYNPYRITSEGIDWEVIEPDDDWSFIGYWGDHQIIYLLRLLELSRQYSKNNLNKLLKQKNYVFANVPYRIRSYNDIVKDPQDTIDFDHAMEATISDRVAAVGADGKLVWGADEQPVRANLTEKLLLTLLTKLSNFVPEAGIWLNTQRPEWNDANNALVGNGTSMVTLYYLRRYLSFCKTLFEQDTAYKLNEPVLELLKSIQQCFEKFEAQLSGQFTGRQRKLMVDELGRVGENYRRQAYAGFDGGIKTVSTDTLQSFFDLSLAFVDHSIQANRREDGMYHAYNLISLGEDTIEVSYLYEMLEGQVAVLTSGLTTPQETLHVLDALKESAMYRDDQYSYMLYPNRDLPRFLQKNNLPESFVQSSKLAQALLSNNDESLLVRDIEGTCHFAGHFNNANSLKEALDELKDGPFSELVAEEYQNFLDMFEEMFDHKAFTGRSGTFFGYEGLGSIYWHMVSKLLLATQEAIGQLAVTTDFDRSVYGKLVDHYYEIRAGIGINKSPDLYGAFPTDPYSHTPGHKGAQQPGMTGQVKEDVINRWAELGVKVNDGKISFEPTFLNPEEFLTEASDFEYFDVSGEAIQIDLGIGELAFTYCQVPVIYQKNSTKGIVLSYADRDEKLSTVVLDMDLSHELFSRTGSIKKIVVGLDM